MCGFSCGKSRPDVGDENIQSSTSSSGKRCSTVRSTFGCVCDCRSREGDGLQEVEAGGTADGACDDNRSDGERRGELEAA